MEFQFQRLNMQFTPIFGVHILVEILATLLLEILFEVLWFIFTVLVRKTQNCTSKTSKNEFEHFVNIVKFQNTTTSVCVFDSLILILFKIQQNRS